MMPLIRISLLIFLLVNFGDLNAREYQRVLKGRVYQNSKPAKGVRVTVDRSKNSYFTSFDGKYEVKASSKSRWIKFSFPDKETKIALDPNGSDYIDCGSATETDKNSAGSTIIKSNKD